MVTINLRSLADLINLNFLADLYPQAQKPSAHFDFSRLVLNRKNFRNAYNNLGACNYYVTNESVDQIVASLNPRGDEEILGIIGAGDQLLGLSEKLSTGRIYGVDYNPFQVFLAGLKIELIYNLGREEYLNFLNNRFANKKWMELFDNLSKVVPSSKQDYLCSIADNFAPELAGGNTEFVGFIHDDKRFEQVRRNLSRINLVQADVRTVFSELPANHFDMIYLSNVFDHLSILDMREKIVPESKRILKKGGRIYISTVEDVRYWTLELKKGFREDRDAYKKGREKLKEGALGSPEWMGDFYVGIKD
ncbi:MAG: class I SAM-dependent methyltransferase [Nanoarchaeota archaeon]